MADPKLKLGNDIWATRQKSLLAYNDEGGNFKSLPFQVDRISGGTYVGRNGLIQYAASNEPRVDFLNNTKGHLLLEPQRTNLQVRSEEFDNSAWTKSNCTVSANQTTSPNGETTADKIIENSGSGSKKVYDSVSTSSGTAYTWSVFLKADTRSKARLNIFGAYAEFDVANQTLLTQSGITSYKIENYGNGWGRFSITETANSSSTLTYVYLLDDAGNVSYTGDGTSGLFVWGGQMEIGTYSTSYIPTSGAAVTRTAETCNITGLQANTMNGATEGTLFLELEYQVESNGDAMQWRSSTSNAGRAYFYNTQMGFADTYGANGVVIYGLTQNSRLKAAFRLNSLSNATVFLNGTKGGTGNGNTWANIGQLLLNGTYWKMKINEIKMYNTALSDSELQALTTI